MAFSSRRRRSSTKHEQTKHVTNFEISDQLYGEAIIPANPEVVSIWLGSNVMVEYPLDEAISFLEERIELVTKSVSILQEDLDFCRRQINIVEVNRSRVHNASIKIEKAKESVQSKS